MLQAAPTTQNYPVQYGNVSEVEKTSAEHWVINFVLKEKVTVDSSKTAKSSCPDFPPTSMLSFTSPAALLLFHNDFSLPSHQLLPTWLWPSDREALTGISLQSIPRQGDASTELAPNIHSCILNGLPLLLGADPTGGLLPTTEVVGG